MDNSIGAMRESQGPGQLNHIFYSGATYSKYPVCCQMTFPESQRGPADPADNHIAPFRWLFFHQLGSVFMFFATALSSHFNVSQCEDCDLICFQNLSQYMFDFNLGRWFKASQKNDANRAFIAVWWIV